MDQQLIVEKLESLRCCVTCLEEKCPKIMGELSADVDAQDIVSLN